MCVFYVEQQNILNNLMKYFQELERTGAVISETLNNVSVSTTQSQLVSVLTSSTFLGLKPKKNGLDIYLNFRSRQV